MQKRLLMKLIALVAMLLIASVFVAQASPPQPMVAIHVSELTQALETMPALPPTPTGQGTTGFQWWTTNWHYLVMYESLKEALHSDGTQFITVSDSDITAGKLLYPDGTPRYPIMISLASEAVRDDEITPLRSYVSAGGMLFLGSSALTRRPDGTSRGDFALATEMGVHMAYSGLQNWYVNKDFSKQLDHRLISHIPYGSLIWQMPMSSEEIPWGTVYLRGQNGPHFVWRISVGDAQTLAMGDSGPLLCVKQYGAGTIIYHGAMQPLIAHGGMDVGMYAYGIFRNAIEWAFESAKAPIIKLSPWRYPYDAAFMVRHDFESDPSLITAIEASAQTEYSLGVKGDYYFCTGALRVNMGSPSATIASLQRAVVNYGATIGSHNGGLKNPQAPDIDLSDFACWHWGPDEALDVVPSGYASGQDYAQASILASFQDLETWLAGTGQSRRTFVSPYFNATREKSFQILEQLGVITVGDQKLSPFPHWTMSTQTAGKRYAHVSLPTSEWFLGNSIGQDTESFSSAALHSCVDWYYQLGALINVYSHYPTTATIENDYVTYSLTKPKLWAANASAIYDWWTPRSGVSMAGSYDIVGNIPTVAIAVAGATDPDTSVEIALPSWNSGLASVSQVFLNGAPADSRNYRTNRNGVKIRVGATFTNVTLQFNIGTVTSKANDDIFYLQTNSALTVAAPGILGNDTAASGKTLTAALVSGPSHGTLRLSADGSFSYTPAAGFSGTDSFTYKANDGSHDSNVATVSLVVPGQSPVANDDSYSVAGSSLSVAAPGVLANDTAAGGKTLKAVLVGGPAHGTLALNDDGSFTYTPTAGFSGSDSFTYKANDGSLNSGVATVTITIPSASLFFDDFTRASDPGPVAPWVALQGNWTVTGGALQGTSAPNNYGNAYIASNWTDYSVQAQIQFASGSYGGGLGGRLDPVTGAHYAAWIYPEGAHNGSASLALVKFFDWWSYSFLEQASLPAVGTGWHTLKLVFQGNQITASLDGNIVANATDDDAGGVAPYLNGGVSADLWTAKTAYPMFVDNVTVVSSGTVAPIANNDAYSIIQDSTLTNAAPGVLSNDIAASGKTLTAALVTGPAHGVLKFNSDGSFSYASTTGYTGSDSFTYKADDGSLDSNPATVTITVTARVQPPVAANDSYTTVQDTTLTYAAPGVLSNDTAASGKTLTAALVTGPAHGALKLNSDGSFSYTPTTGYTGLDSFTYKANDGSLDSNPATVTITVTAAGTLFSDDFTRSADPGPLAPWVAQQGSWTVTGGTLQLSSTRNTYGYVYLTNIWNDYSLQGQIKFGSGAYGGGLGGRLNRTTGARYAAWIYPEGSQGSSAVLRWVKFSSWSVFSTLQQVNLPNVGTGWHTLTLAFQGNQMTASLDGNIVATVTDGSGAYTSGGISADLWTLGTSYTMSVDNVAVTALAAPAPVANNDSFTVAQNTALTNAAPGILSNDTAANGKSLTAVLVSGPAHGTLKLNADGSFSYTPAAGYSGSDSFTYKANDGSLDSNTATVTITVTSTGVLFSDDFTRSSDPGPLTPWIAQRGTWKVSGGVLQGTSTVSTYGNVYITNSWNDYSLQGQIQMGSGVYGGGLGGRLNASTGAHYAAWIYPEGSQGSSAVLRLIKFTDWSGFITMQQVNLPNVGTNWHTLKLKFQGAQITASWDGTQVGSATDNGFGGTGAYSNGAISADLWTTVKSAQVSIDNIAVSAP